MMFVLFILMGLSPTIHATPLTIKIGAIFHVGDEANAEAFKLALETLAAEQIAPTFQLESAIEWVKSSADSFSTSLAGKITQSPMQRDIT
uniref:Ionotropic receptor 3 n=1 Tax=Macrocentrus cingulum TaxID=535359 RepID=A0A0H3U5S8_9HYME|nr:ionotropic receptor 3 [Macrocentrus cingulum]